MALPSYEGCHEQRAIKTISISNNVTKKIDSHLPNKSMKSRKCRPKWTLQSRAKITHGREQHEKMYCGHFRVWQQK